MTGHLLRVTADPAYPDDREEHSGEVVCAGVTGNCRAWFECREEHEFDTDLYETVGDAYYDDVTVWHGVEHQRIDGDLMTPSEQCIGVALDGSWDEANEQARAYAPGDYPCDLTYEGDGEVRIEVLS
jgi:hypothetical protein